MISDFVKGRKKDDFPAGIRDGITLHRLIDTYTDQHEATRRAKTVFRPAYRLYAAAFTDVVFDHFLANDEQELPGDTLKVFAEKVYGTVDISHPLIPLKFASMFPYMKRQNWLYNYRFMWGIERSFEGLARRASGIPETDTAFLLFKENYAFLKECYTTFFPDLKSFTITEYKRILENGNE